MAYSYTTFQPQDWHRESTAASFIGSSVVTSGGSEVMGSLSSRCSSLCWDATSPTC